MGDRLFDCPDDAIFNQLLSIVGRGVPVVTRASWVLAKGNPEHIPKESVIRHVPLVEKEKVVFVHEGFVQVTRKQMEGSEFLCFGRWRTWSFHCDFKCMWRR